MSAAAAAARRICYLTDVEGNFAYVRNVVRHSKCLRLVPRTTQPAAAAAAATATDASADDSDLELLDDCFLVYGGDAGDKGGETLQCYEQLVRLKKKYPDRVVLLVGNRDVNKMRFTSELSDSEMDLHTMAKQIRDGPAWVPLDKRVTLETFLMHHASQSHDNNNDGANADASARLAAANTKVNRLQWMLEHTMGAQGDFERRRTELTARRSRVDAAPAVDDDAVVASYLDSVDAGGAVREYLELGSLAFIVRDTLFVHGGIVNGAHADNDDAVSALHHIPGTSSDDACFGTVHEWVDALNAWYKQQIAEWLIQPVWSPDRSTRGGNALLEYVLPTAHASVVMGRHVDASGMPTRVPHAIAQALAASGITRVVVGHTPHGNCPTVIKQPRLTTSSAVGFTEVIMCDTSYSDMDAQDNRGDAAAELVVAPDGRVHVHGVLNDGRAIAYCTTDDRFIGRRLKDGTHVKAKLARKDDDDTYVVVTVTNGYSYAYATRTRREIEAIGLVE